MTHSASRPVLIVAPQLETLLGLSQALLKFGFQIMTAYPQAPDVERGARMHPVLVLLCPPADAGESTRNPNSSAKGPSLLIPCCSEPVAPCR